MLSPSRSAALAVLLAVLPVTPVLSLHQMAHRYDVAGYILSADHKIGRNLVITSLSLM